MADPPPEARTHPGAPLRTWERVLALLIGVAFAVLAVFALFVTDNQAGTAALLLVAAAFLLIGVQGTALVRFGSGSTSVELDRRLADAVRRADEVAERDPQLALGILEGAAIIEPRIGPAASAARAMNYESAVRQALERVQPAEATVTAAQPPLDFAVVAPAGTVLVSVVFRQSRGVQMIDLAPLVGSRQLEDAAGGLAVVNHPSSASVTNYVATAAGHGVRIEVVTWETPQHDRDLAEALTRLLSPTPPSESLE
jgi:hypothetical protein